jgi:NADH-quinone oxidoreductase subunit L
MAIGLFLLFTSLGTLQIQPIMQRATQQWAIGSGLAVASAALLLGGAVGKSAQLPLQVWLPDAMAGPTPTSALIHAATMVTAGVYLIARTHVLYSLAPAVQLAVAVIGAATLLLAGFSALTQRDLKRVLAYSTISQIGYMFLALGVGAWSAALFHFMTHAFFKALLFLGAGVVIHALHDEHDMFKMGGLRKQLPVTFWTFLIGSASLTALPLVTAGFYSKDSILWEAWSSPAGSPWLWAAGLAGALLTSIYTFRMVFVTFFGEAKHPAGHTPGLRIEIPLVVLAGLSLVGGFVELPDTLGNFHLFSDFMRTALPAVNAAHAEVGTELIFQIIAGAVSISGILLAFLFFLHRPRLAESVASNPVGAALHRWWFAGWGFDWLYETFVVRPFVWAAEVSKSDIDFIYRGMGRAYMWLGQINKNDFIEFIYRGIAWTVKALYLGLSRTQSGRVRWYAAAIVAGAVIIIAMVVFL